MRSRLALASVLLFALASACGSGASSSSPPADAAPDEDAAPGDSDPEAPLDEVLEGAREDQRALGAGAAVLVGGGDLWVGVSGDRAPGGPALTPSDRHQIGSITKTFTAVVILQLAEEEQLSLEDKLDRWYPDFPGAEEITVRHLLNHTSGVHEYLADPDAGFTEPVEHEELLDYPREQGLDFAPGSQWSYSNTNYILLGLIAEKVSDDSYASLVRAGVLEPLGLEDTFVNGPEDIPGGYLRGFDRRGDDYVSGPEEHPSRAWSAGSIVSSLPDQIRFFQGLFGGELLAPASLEAMKTGVEIPNAPPGTRYGLGISWEETPHGTRYSHGGLIDSFFSVTAYTPDADLFAAVYVNTYPADDYALLDAVSDAALDSL